MAGARKESFIYGLLFTSRSAGGAREKAEKKLYYIPPSIPPGLARGLHFLSSPMEKDAVKEKE